MSFEDHWPNNRPHQWKQDGSKESCKECGAIRSPWHSYPCGSHPWDCYTDSGVITAGVSEHGGFYPLAWPDSLTEDGAVDAMRKFFDENHDVIIAVLGNPVRSEA